MVRRYREPIEVVADALTPARFRWRGRMYHVRAVLGHWREDGAYWEGGRLEIPQRDLWRVEAADLRGCGVYELLCESGRWLLDRVWD